MPTRREFLKLSAAAAIGAALWGCNGPDGFPTAKPTDAEPTKSIPPTKKAEVTDTPNVPATKEAERLNAVLAEGYPTSFAELSQEKMLSEADFLKQLEKFPNIGKEYKQVKAMLSAGLSKEKVGLSDIAFEVSSFAWDSDKYSWIVIARNSKTGEVYVPRDGKTHTRNIDMSVYGYLKEYQAGGALPFTMEPLKLPEFSGPEYKVGFARSKKGWLVASLDGGSQKGWYDFRDKEVARWKNDRDSAIILKEGIFVEDGSYNEVEKAVLQKHLVDFTSALKKGLVFKHDLKSDWSGVGTPLIDGKINFIICLRECISGNKVEKVPVAIEVGTGYVALPSSKNTYSVITRSEMPFVIERSGLSDIAEKISIRLKGLLRDVENPTYCLRYLDGLMGFVYRSQSQVVKEAQYKEMLAVKFLPDRKPNKRSIRWSEVSTEKVDVSDAAVEKWLNSIFQVSANGQRRNIIVNGVGLGGYKIDYDFLSRVLSRVKELDSDTKRIVLRSVPQIQIVESGVSQGGGDGVNIIRLGVQAIESARQGSREESVLISQFAHECRHSAQLLGVRDRQQKDTPLSSDDLEFYPYMFQLNDLDSLGVQDSDRYYVLVRNLLYSGDYAVN